MRGASSALAPVGTPGTLAAFIARHRNIVVLTGAGCSTRSGIPAYRDGDGRWLQRHPILYQDFIASARIRRRYWARSYFGWPLMRQARCNGAHRALAALEAGGRIAGVITQNVDSLHRRAGQRRLIELHGRLDRVRCLDCHGRMSRDDLQDRLAALNPDWSAEVLGVNADGDAELDARAWPGFEVAPCESCSGRLKPEVVFFGESIRPEVRHATDRLLDGIDALLVVGSSLVVGSAYRLVREAARRGAAVAAVNDGRTRAEALLEFKVAGDCEEVLAQAASDICGETPAASASK